jgi:POT family proton-dependent oligopeptide transporter
VLIDPQVTVQRYLMIFYWCINVGAFFAVATEYAERDVGFWLAFLLPGIIYMLMPIVLVIAYKKLYKAPPQGSVVLEATKVFQVLLGKGGWKRMWKGGDFEFWNRAKPSYIAARDSSIDLNSVFWDDRFVDEIKQSLHACAVFALIPIFALADGGIGNQLNDMSDAMILQSVPNDLIGNFNSLAIIVFAPILNFGLYPFFAKIGHPLKPMMRMSIGFMLGCITCIICAIVQWRVYKTSPCGYYATTCVTNGGGPSAVSLWWQIPIYFFPAVGELFVNVTSYELAYTRSPARMKGVVYALALFNSAIAAAIGLACSKAITDPKSLICVFHQ